MRLPRKRKKELKESYFAVFVGAYGEVIRKEQGVVVPPTALRRYARKAARREILTLVMRNGRTGESVTMHVGRQG